MLLMDIYREINDFPKRLDNADRFCYIIAKKATSSLVPGLKRMLL